MYSKAPNYFSGSIAQNVLQCGPIARVNVCQILFGKMLSYQTASPDISS